jgi:glycosyltransferase involved in cell wall biosynthesis
MLAKVIDLGCKEQLLKVIPMGVDLHETFVPDSECGEERGRSEILFVGRLVEKKGLDSLIRAMPNVLKEHPDSILTIIGYGPEKPKLRALCEKLKVDASVKFEGAVANFKLPEYYRRATVFAAPFVRAGSGDEEGLGLVLIEALGCGCPAIVSDIAAARDITKGLKGVITTPQKDTVALSNALIKVLDDPIKFRSQVLGDLPILVERFSWQAVGERYSKLLVDVSDL